MEKDLRGLKLQDYYSKFEISRMLLHIGFVGLIIVVLLINTNSDYLGSKVYLLLNLLLGAAAILLIFLFITVTIIYLKIKKILKEKNLE